MIETSGRLPQAPRTLLLWLAALLSCALLVLDIGRRPAPPEPAAAPWPQGGPGHVLRWERVAQGHIPMPEATPAAHASSLLAMPAGHPAALVAFWFAGTRESAPDVQIASSSYLRATQQWTPARFVVNRHALGKRLGFGKRRLGNPVAWLDAQGRIHLFVVGTGLGGWAASRIVHLRQRAPTQDPTQLEFEVQRVLPLSWLWNTSFLVRSAALPLLDGGMILPVHFELGIKYPVALRFNAEGEFVGMQRISSRSHLLQPSLLVQAPTQWLALMRDQRPQGKVSVARTEDGGQTWTDLADLALDNPNSSVAALALGPATHLLAHNSSPGSRNTLDLSYSADGVHWQVAQRLAQGSGLAEYSYPALAWSDARLWVSYTDQRQSVAWQQFVPVESPP